MNECTCSGKNMQFGRCCKLNIERADFERWYDSQTDGRIEPWDVWKAAAKHTHAVMTKEKPE